MDEASSPGLLCRLRLAQSGRESDWAASFSDPMMGEPSGSSRREARTREEHQTGKRRRSRKALDLNRPNREEPGVRNPRMRAGKSTIFLVSVNSDLSDRANSLPTSYPVGSCDP